MTAPRQALRTGTIVEYAGAQATVVSDSGGSSIEVRANGHRMNWAWDACDPLCQVIQVPHGKTFYSSFNDYVADFPEGEHYRAWLTRHGRDCMLVKLSDDPEVVGAPHGGLPGNYMWVNLSAYGDTLSLVAHDCDDGMMRRDFRLDQKTEAEQVLRDLCQLAPLTMWEAADVLGFHWE